MTWKTTLKIAAAVCLAIGRGGLLLPERLVIPVQGATLADWNPKSFWHRPWGRSGVHRGIDITRDAETGRQLRAESERFSVLASFAHFPMGHRQVSGNGLSLTSGGFMPPGLGESWEILCS